MCVAEVASGKLANGELCKVGDDCASENCDSEVRPYKEVGPHKQAPGRAVPSHGGIRTPITKCNGRVSVTAHTVRRTPITKCNGRYLTPITKCNGRDSCNDCGVWEAHTVRRTPITMHPICTTTFVCTSRAPLHGDCLRCTTTACVICTTATTTTCTAGYQSPSYIKPGDRKSVV